MIKAHILGKLQKGLEIFICFPWETHDDRRPQNEARYLRPQNVEKPHELFLAIPPPHPLENTVSGMLHGDVEIPAQNPAIAEIDDLQLKAVFSPKKTDSSIKEYNILHIEGQGLEAPRPEAERLSFAWSLPLLYPATQLISQALPVDPGLLHRIPFPQGDGLVF